MASDIVQCFTKKKEKKKKTMFMSRGQMLAQRGRDVYISQAQAQMLDGKLVYWMFNIDNNGM